MGHFSKNGSNSNKIEAIFKFIIAMDKNIHIFQFKLGPRREEYKSWLLSKHGESTYLWK